MKSWWMIGAVTAVSCASLFTPKPLEPTMKPFVDKLDPGDYGVIPTNLSGSVGAVDAPAPTMATASNNVVGETMQHLEYAGLTDKGMCFLYRGMNPPTDDTAPGDTIVKNLQADTLNDQAGGLYLLPVAKLEDINDLPRWPPPAGATRITSVEKLSDEPLTTTEKKDSGGGDYVEVKHDYRMLLVELCAAKPAITPATKYLVGVRHLGPHPGEPQFETTESGDHEAHNEEVRREHDAFFVWELSDDGKFAAM